MYYIFFCERYALKTTFFVRVDSKLPSYDIFTQGRILGEKFPPARNMWTTNWDMQIDSIKTTKMSAKGVAPVSGHINNISAI